LNTSKLGGFYEISNEALYEHRIITFVHYDYRYDIKNMLEQSTVKMNVVINDLNERIEIASTIKDETSISLNVGFQSFGFSYFLI
jgi:DNA-binding ferritin-like protein